MLKFVLSSCSHKEEILIYNSVTILWNEQKLNAKTQNNYKVYPHLSHSFIKINIKNSHFQKKKTQLAQQLILAQLALNLLNNKWLNWLSEINIYKKLIF